MEEQLSAVKAIQNIHGYIHESTTLQFSASRLIAIGFCILLVPFIYVGVPVLLMDLRLTHHGIYNIVQYALPVPESAYWEFQYFVLQSVVCILFSLGVLKLSSPCLFRNAQHPVLRKVTSVHSIALFAILFTAYALAFVEKFELIIPTAMLVLGLLYFLYGQFSRKLIQAFGAIFLIFSFTNVLFLKFLPSAYSLMILFLPGFVFLGLGMLLAIEKKSLNRWRTNDPV
jgi:hypothetical protein